MKMTVLALAATLTLAVHSTQASSAPSQPGIDAPSLAALGSHGVGFKSFTLIQPDQADLQQFDFKTGVTPRHDRTLIVDVWYPAIPRKGAVPVTYKAAFRGEPPRPAASFSFPGLAVRGAKADGSGYPLVIVSHGYSNEPAGMTWLTENLASKGYVVAAIHHQDPDPDRSDPVSRAAPFVRRPLDIGYVARTLPGLLGPQIDASAVALIGYSMGGYGVVTAGGASLDPKSAVALGIPGGEMVKIAKGGADAALAQVANVKAIVAMAPAGGSAGAWNTEGLADISAPMLLISGDRDLTVDYATGAKAIYGAAIHSDRYLLTYRFGGHAIGLNPAPVEMRSQLWDLDWFEDPIWRTDRTNAINLHFISAFLDLKLKGQADRAAYLDVADVVSDDGVWPYDPKAPYGDVSPAKDGITVWKGFHRRHAKGLELRHARPVQ